MTTPATLTALADGWHGSETGSTLWAGGECLAWAGRKGHLPDGSPAWRWKAYPAGGPWPSGRCGSMAEARAAAEQALRRALRGE